VASPVSLTRYLEELLGAAWHTERPPAVLGGGDPRGPRGRGKVIYAPPCIFRQTLFIENTQGAWQ
jgi:hypothetical protein